MLFDLPYKAYKKKNHCSMSIIYIFTKEKKNDFLELSAPFGLFP